MPIYNDLFGVWKLLVYEDPLGVTANDCAYVVKSAKESVQQESSPEYFVQGTALPFIQNIGGGTADLEIVAPLLVKAHPHYFSLAQASSYARANSVNPGGDDLHDGFTLWCRLMGNSSGLGSDFFSGLYQADPGFVIKNAGLEVTNTGATYTIGLTGDTNFLGSENGVGKGWKVIDASDGADWTRFTTTSGIKPFPPDMMDATQLCPLRVATFYDIVASTEIAGSVLQGFIERLSINLSIETQKTNVVGQQTQRPIMGISGVNITFSGTLVYNTRQPFGYLFPWQSMNNDEYMPGMLNTTPRVPDAYKSYGGTGKYSSFSLSVGLRNGGSNSPVLPLLPYLGIDKAIFKSSSVDVSNDFIRTTFEGQGWVSNPNFLTTDLGENPTGTGTPM